VANVYEPEFDDAGGEPGFRFRRARIGEQAGTSHLGFSVWELEPDESTVFHYHLGNEEALIVTAGRPSLRTRDGWRELAPGDLVVCPRGEDGAHGVANRTSEPVRVLLVSEMNEPNVTVYPDLRQVGVNDRASRAERRFGALFDLDAAADAYAGANRLPPLIADS
jgi:uncharacterized cupin superfamily protein